MAARRLAHEEELQATRSQRRAVVYLTVEWAMQERQSRKTFAEFVERVESGYPNLGVSFWVLDEECDGAAEWFRGLQLTDTAGRGYGAVVWLDGGEVKERVVYAAAVGVDGLLRRTLGLWSTAFQSGEAAANDPG